MPASRNYLPSPAKMSIPLRSKRRSRHYLRHDCLEDEAAVDWPLHISPHAIDEMRAGTGRHLNRHAPSRAAAHTAFLVRAFLEVATRLLPYTSRRLLRKAAVKESISSTRKFFPGGFLIFIFHYLLIFRAAFFCSSSIYFCHFSNMQRERHNIEHTDSRESTSSERLKHLFPDDDFTRANFTAFCRRLIMPYR